MGEVETRVSVRRSKGRELERTKIGVKIFRQREGLETEYRWVLASEFPDNPGRTGWCPIEHFLQLSPGTVPGFSYPGLFHFVAVVSRRSLRFTGPRRSANRQASGLGRAGLAIDQAAACSNPPIASRVMSSVSSSVKGSSAVMLKGS